LSVSSGKKKIGDVVDWIDLFDLKADFKLLKKLKAVGVV